ncbi:steroid 17-alpha-hydroxylase/17,20 lyase [Salmo salar]|uniref:Steroid 17-alpha-hydroxylase/17,20 lyase n=1 Tax=Salmo salar TaxID=8030 RepID=A0ABM3F210_SALSA|nr:steroid 17-alpha-hydroxylase/17,20 lyase [Salmo salar]
MASGGSMVSVLSTCPTTLLLWVLAGITACLLLKGVMRLTWGDSHPPSYPPLPCLPSLPLLGSLLSLTGDQPPHLRFTELGHRYGPLYALYLGPHYTVVVNTFRHAREVLLQRGKEFAGRPKMLTTELLTRGGKDIAFSDYSPLWKIHRRLVHNSFTLFGEGTTKLQRIVLEAVEDLCCDLQANRGKAIDPEPPLMRAVTNVVCTLVFSSTYQPGDPELTSVMEYNDGIVQTIARGGLVDIFPWLRFLPNRTLTTLKECIAVRDQLLSKKLEEHKVSLIGGEPRDLLDALLQGQTRIKHNQGSGVRDQGLGAEQEEEEEGISDDHVLMTAAEAFGAGVETTSTTLLWVLAFLLHHPQVQERVQKELDEVVGCGRSPDVSDRPHLPYLDSVINEVMRIRPVSPVLIPHTALTHSR